MEERDFNKFSPFRISFGLLFAFVKIQKIIRATIYRYIRVYKTTKKKNQENIYKIEVRSQLTQRSYIDSVPIW